MHRWLMLWGTVCALSVATATGAETRYVTDRLYLGLYPEPEAQGKPLRTLVSGTAVEVLESRRNYTRVRLSSGEEGWVKSAFLVDETPPRFRLTALESAQAQAEERIARLRSELGQARDRAAGLEARARQCEVARQDAEDRLRALGAREEELRARLENIGYSVRWTWALAAVVLAAVLGFIGGWSWLDRKIRKRHGGFRIY